MQVSGQPLPGTAALVLPIMRRLSVADKIDHMMPKAWHNGISRGLAAEALLACILHPGAPLALSRVKQQLRHHGLDVVLDVDADQLHDDKLGEMLDALVPVDDAGDCDLSRVQQLEQHCAHQAIAWLDLRPQQVLFDFTRLRLSGAYQQSELAQPGRGSGADAQLQIGLNSLAEIGLPVLSEVHPGNANHTVNVPANLAALQRRLPGRKLTVTTDSAGLCHENIIAYHRAGVYFISPKQLTEAEKRRMRSYANDEFERLDYEPESGGRFWGLETTWRLQRQKHKEVLEVRVLIVRSSALRRQETGRLIRATRKLVERLQQINGYLNRHRYFHAEYAQQQLDQAVRRSAAGPFVRCELRGESGDLSLQWDLDVSALRQHCRRLGRYVLFTSAPRERYDGSALLRAYKAQHQVEANFRQLKSHLFVAPVFLKNENRILALTALYVIALMIVSILQFLARKAGLATPRQRAITGRELLLSYGGWSAVAVTVNGRRYLLPNPPTPEQSYYLDQLSFPPPQHWIPQRYRLPEHLRIPGM